MKTTKKKTKKPAPKLKSRERTEDEVRDEFLNEVVGIVDYWCHLESERNHSDVYDAEWRCAGVAFSILVMLDGEHAMVPGFVVAPCPHPTDKKWSIDNGLNWYPPAPKVKVDIAGALHEHFAKMR